MTSVASNEPRSGPLSLPGCASCAHINVFGLTCAAFPDGIPMVIAQGDFDHTQPFPGDNGIQWEQVTESQAGAKAMISVRPYMRDGHQVEGYLRDADLVVGATVRVRDDAPYHPSLLGQEGRVHSFDGTHATVFLPEYMRSVRLPHDALEMVTDDHSHVDIPQGVYDKMKTKLDPDGRSRLPETPEAALAIAMRIWRADFAWSSNIRTRIEGREMAPAFKDDKGMMLYADVIKEGLARAKPLDRPSWRIVAALSPPKPGQSVMLRAAAVGFSRGDVMPFRHSFLLGSDHPTLYKIPGEAQGITFPDGQEAIVQGKFKVASVERDPVGGEDIATLEYEGSVWKPTKAAKKTVNVRSYERDGHPVRGYLREGGIPDSSPAFQDVVLAEQERLSQLSYNSPMHDSALRGPVEGGNTDLLPFEEWHALREKNIKILMEAEPEIRIRIPAEFVGKVLSDGAVLNQHATGHSQAAFNPEGRSDLEGTEFGINTLDPDAYPVYGYLEGSREKTKYDTLPTMYGNVVLRLKRGVRERTTFTADDSLNANHAAVPYNDFYKPSLAPSPVTAPSSLSVPAWMGTLEDARSLRGLNSPYLEAQVHGGVHLHDIAEVVFTEGQAPDKETEKRLADAGLKWRVTEGADPE